MPNRDNYLDPLPGKDVSKAFLDTLRREAQVGGAVDATSGLAAGAKLVQGMGAAGSAIAGLGGQRLGPKLPGTETLEVGPEVGGRAGATVAQIILAVPERALPGWFRAVLKNTPESKLPNLMRSSWEALNEGHRGVYKNKGVVGKIDEEDLSLVENLREFLKGTELKAKGSRGELFRSPEPLAYSTETDTAFSRFVPNRQKADPKSEMDQNVINRWRDRSRDEQVWDTGKLMSGPDSTYLHNWGISQPKTGNPFGVGFDLGASGNIPIPPMFREIAGQDPKFARKMDMLERFGQPDPNMDKFFEVLKKSK